MMKLMLIVPLFLIRIDAFRVRSRKHGSASKAKNLAGAAANASTGTAVETESIEVAAAKSSIDLEAKVQANATAVHASTESTALLGPATTHGAMGEPGQVDFLYTFGAPGTGSPGLKNWKTSNGCFPGLRTWTAEGDDGWFTQRWVDIVPVITYYVSYWHVLTDTEQVQVKNKLSNQITRCKSDMIYKPDSLAMSISLHDKEQYIRDAGKKSDKWWENVTIFCSRESYAQDPVSVANSVMQYGWRHVGYGLFEGGSLYGGRQISHLMQRPDTLECVLTFQGTSSPQGWLENANVKAVSFCGMTEEGEWCAGIGTCRPKNKMGSFVHYGFKQRLSYIVRSPTWQTNVRPHLSKCSTLSVGGHSLGGAVAELFAACASRAPKPGEFGYEDYEYMGWTKGQPARLNYIDDDK